MGKIIILLTEHFFFPLLFLLWQFTRRYKSKVDGFLMLALTGVYISRLYFVGSWHVFGFYYRYLFGVAFLLFSVKTFYDVRNLPVWVPKGPREKFGISILGFLSLIFLGLSLWAFWGKWYSGESINLDHPLKNGTFYIAEGGDSPLINQYHLWPPVPEKFSVDFVKVNGGCRAEGLFPEDLNDYEIYGEKVYSPCQGIIFSVTDSLPDNLPFEPDTSRKPMWGNRVVIERPDGILVLLGCLQKGRVQVGVGDRVRTGDPLGYVGNSRYGTEPHLHIHAMKKNIDPGFPWPHKGIPVLFERKFLTKNSWKKVP